MSLLRRNRTSGNRFCLHLTDIRELLYQHWEHICSAHNRPIERRRMYTPTFDRLPLSTFVHSTHATRHRLPAGFLATKRAKGVRRRLSVVRWHQPAVKPSATCHKSLKDSERAGRRTALTSGDGHVTSARVTSVKRNSRPLRGCCGSC
jgi:hypothetical protein